MTRSLMSALPKPEMTVLVELTNEEIHALIEWHDTEAAFGVGSEDEIENRKRSRARADELWFLITGSRRKHADGGADHG